MEHSAIPQALTRMQPFWGAWYIDAYIGSGAFGKVYRIVREDMGEKFYAALKWLPLPADEEEFSRLKSDGMSLPNIDTYYKDMVNDLRREIKLLSDLKGNSHIVSYEDHLTRKRPDETGWDILIRMELLTPLSAHLTQRKDSVTCRDVIMMGIHLCDALALCQKNNILHRDIKPENIFFSASGHYKLGDFGIARKIEAVSDKMSRVGTPPYMAPEVFRGGNYGSTVDLYSLGLVMYKLLNSRREPFLPAAPGAYSPSEEENARLRRMNGEPLPKPRHGSEALWTILQRACAPLPQDRYSSPVQMQKELEAVLYDPEMEKSIFPEGESTILLGTPDTLPKAGENPYTVKLDHKLPPKEETEQLQETTGRPLPPALRYTPPVQPAKNVKGGEGGKKKHWFIWGAAGALVLAVAAAVLLLLTNTPRLDNLMARQSTSASLTIDWTDSREGPWTISYVQKDLPSQAQTVQSEKPSVELLQLIPGVSYDITVANDQTGSRSVIALPAAFAPKAPAEQVRLVGKMRSYAYRRSEYSSALEVYNDNKIIDLPDFVFAMTEKPLESQENGYIVSYYLRFAESHAARNVTIKAVLRFKEHGAFQTASTISASAAQGDLITDMDALFVQVWKAWGCWPAEAASLEIYADELLVSEQKCMIQTDQMDGKGT